jgi:hypothetical protein
MIEEIKKEYKKIPCSKRRELLEQISEDLNKSFFTVRQRWFCQYWNIPIKQQKKVLKIIEKKLANVNF